MTVTFGLVDCPAVVIPKSVDTLPVNVIGPATAGRAPSNRDNSQNNSGIHFGLPCRGSFLCKLFRPNFLRRRTAPVSLGTTMPPEWPKKTKQHKPARQGVLRSAF